MGNRLGAGPVISPMLHPSTTRAMLVGCGQGEDRHRFLPFPLSWVQPKRNGVRLATEPPLPIFKATQASGTPPAL